MKPWVSLVVIGILISSGVGTSATIMNSGEADKYELLIIAPEMFYDALQPLITHKNSKGIDTTLIVLEDIYENFSGRDDAEQVKYGIKHAVETWDVHYVLLVGGRKPSLLGEPWLLPVRYSHIIDPRSNPHLSCFLV